MVVTTRFPPRRRAGPILLTALTVVRPLDARVRLLDGLLAVAGALFVSGLADGVSVVIRIVILRVESPEAMRGRIASVNYLFIGASNELGAFESGVAATFFGVVPSVVGGGILTLIVVGAVAILAPQLRRLDLGRRMRRGPRRGAPGRCRDGRPGGGRVERIASGELGGEGARSSGRRAWGQYGRRTQRCR